MSRKTLKKKRFFFCYFCNNFLPLLGFIFEKNKIYSKKKHDEQIFSIFESSYPPPVCTFYIFPSTDILYFLPSTKIVYILFRTDILYFAPCRPNKRPVQTKKVDFKKSSPDTKRQKFFGDC